MCIYIYIYMEFAALFAASEATITFNSPTNN